MHEVEKQAICKKGLQYCMYTLQYHIAYKKGVVVVTCGESMWFSNWEHARSSARLRPKIGQIRTGGGSGYLMEGETTKKLTGQVAERFVCLV